MSCVQHYQLLATGARRAAHDSWLSSGLSPPRSLRESTSITVTMTDWKRILSEVPISHSTETFAYFVHFLCVFWRRSFFRGHVMGQKSLRGMILVSWHQDHHHGPQQLRSHQARCQEWAPPSSPGVTFYFNWGDTRRRRETNISSRCVSPISSINQTLDGQATAERTAPSKLKILKLFMMNFYKIFIVACIKSIWSTGRALNLNQRIEMSIVNEYLIFDSLEAF